VSACIYVHMCVRACISECLLVDTWVGGWMDGWVGGCMCVCACVCIETARCRQLQAETLHVISTKSRHQDTQKHAHKHTNAHTHAHNLSSTPTIRNHLLVAAIDKLLRLGVYCCVCYVKHLLCKCTLSVGLY